jgi:hypothetical protein
MRYVQLRAFHYVAMCGGFSRAAEMLFLTQPAISDQVRKLEEEYDVLLFNRSQEAGDADGARACNCSKSPTACSTRAAGARPLVGIARAALRHAAHRRRRRAPSAAHSRPVPRKISPASRSRSAPATPRRSFPACSPTKPISACSARSRKAASSRSLKLNSTPIIAFVATDHPLATAKSMTLHELALHAAGHARTRLEDARRSWRTSQSQEALALQAGDRGRRPRGGARDRRLGRRRRLRIGGRVRTGRATGPDPDRCAPMLMDEALICLRERSRRQAGAGLPRYR